MPTSADERYLTTKQLCGRYSVNRETIRRWRTTGRLPQPITFGSFGQPRYRLSDLEAFERRLERV